MIKQFIWKQRKIQYGILRTYFGRSNEPYEPERWFDRHYGTGVSDRQTIANDKGMVSTQYHYASVELLITRHLFNHGVKVQDSSVFDIGSGAGHWIDFYKALGAAKCTGIDISEGPFNHLLEKYRGDDSVQINKGLFQDFLESTADKYDIINGIGVLFHVVDDAEWVRGLRAIADSLQDGGYLIVGGHFGFFNNINVQFDSENKVNKRLRSKRAWSKTLKSFGFKKFYFHRNDAYLHINEPIPENNILIATK